jgi:hypothetical protein
MRWRMTFHSCLRVHARSIHLVRPRLLPGFEFPLRLPTNGVREDENASDLPETSEEGESVVLLGAEGGYDGLYAYG